MTIGRLRYLVWRFVSELERRMLTKFYKMDIGEGAVISHKATLDKGVGKRIHIGKRTWVLAHSVVLGHDVCRNLVADTYIGDDCVIGIRSIIMPGLTIGNQVVIGGMGYCGD